MLMDIAPLTPEEIFWINFEQYLPLITAAVFAVTAVAVFFIIKAFSNKK